MIPGGIIGHEGGLCIILLLVPLGPVNIIYLVWGTNSDMIFGPMGPLLGGTNFTVTVHGAVTSDRALRRHQPKVVHGAGTVHVDPPCECWCMCACMSILQVVRVLGPRLRGNPPRNTE